MALPFAVARTTTLGRGADQRGGESRRWKDQKRNDEDLVRRAAR